MSKISTIEIRNFKFFTARQKEQVIELGHKQHMLMYGENGSGKSSVYWSLYTLLEASRKKKRDTDLYFNPCSSSSLVNIYATPADGQKTIDSFVSVTTDAGHEFKLSKRNNGIWSDAALAESRLISDFINYQDIYELSRLKLGDEANLFKVFSKAVLPYTPCKNFHSDLANRDIDNLGDLWTACSEGIYKFYGIDHLSAGDPVIADFENLIDHFNSQMKSLERFINRNIAAKLQRFGYDFKVRLKYEYLKYPSFGKHTGIKNGRLLFDSFKIITTVEVDGVKIHRPQKFLNEAKLVAVSLAIRFVLLERRPHTAHFDSLKFLALDDIMISLDMSNRDKLMDILLTDYADKYQLLMFTHDERMQKFIWSKIGTAGQTSDWTKKGIYSTHFPAEGPVVIDEAITNSEKAHKYFKACDYTTSAIYVRKMYEAMFASKLAREQKSNGKGGFITLEELWNKVKAQYHVDEKLANRYQTTNNMVLNVAAHNQTLSMPVYRRELEAAFKLYDEIDAACKVSRLKIYLRKGMQCVFTHPDPAIDFIYIICMDADLTDLNLKPKAKILYWKYNGVEFYDFDKNDGSALAAPPTFTPNIVKIGKYLIREIGLGITKNMLLDNTTVCRYTLRQTIDTT